MRKPFSELHAGQVFDNLTFEAEFERDLQRAQHVVLIQSAYLTLRGVERFKRQFEACISRGVRICAFLQPPSNWSRRLTIPDGPERDDIAKFEAALKKLEALKIHVTLRVESHLKLIVIDECKVWDGCLNSLSYNRKEERYTRYIDVRVASDAIKKHRLDQCGECAFDNSHFVDEISVTPATVGKLISGRRKFLGLAQKKLARDVRKDPALMSDIERGKHVPGLQILIDILRALGGELIVVPPPLIPAVRRLVRLWYSQYRRR